MNNLDTFLANKIIDTSVTSITWVSIALAGALAPAFAMFNFTFNLASHVLQGKPRFLDYNQIARCLIIMTLIGLYIPLMWFINLPINAAIETFQDLNTTLIASKIAAPAVAGTEISFFDAIGNFFDTIFTMIFGGLSLIIYFIIRIFLTMIIKVLYIVGPLSFALSLIPMFKDQMNNWISAYVSTCSCLVTQDILRKLLDVSFETIGVSAAAPSGFFVSQILNVTIVALHISVFWLTKQWVGNASAGSVFSNAISAMSAAAGAKLGSAMGNAGGGGGASSNAEKAADAFQNSNTSPNT